MKPFHPNRRKFLKLSSAVVGSGLILGMSWGCSAEDQGSGNSSASSFSPNAWLVIDNQGTVTIFVAESEMGQGPYTLMPMLLAEELEVEWNSIVVKHASLDPAFGYQATGGSASIRKGWSTLREAGAIAREMLLQAGAAALQAAVSDCKAAQGKIIHKPSGRKIPYRELVGSAAKLPIPEKARLKELHEFVIIGQSIPRTDIPDKINGKARFGIDIKLPDMLYATITHCPVFGGSVRQVNASKARKIKGVIDIFEINEGIVVVATDTWTAFQGKDALEIDWNPGKNATLSTVQIADRRKKLSPGQGETTWQEGDAEAILSSGKTVVQADYIQPPQAHIPLETMNCTAHFRDDGKLQIWVPTQSPSKAHETAKLTSQSIIKRGLNKLFGAGSDDIEIQTTLLGGGFGRRLKQDFVSQAVQIAQRFKQPVQLVWTREEDVQHDFYHPLTLHKMRGALDKNGLPVAWELFVSGTKISASGISPPPYAIANTKVVIKNTDEAIPRGPWRSVFAHYNAFAAEHFLDEMARAGKQDPLDLRLRLLGDHPRLQKVLKAAARGAGWPGQAGTGYLGIAAFSSFGSHVAEVVELRRSDKQGLVVHKVTCAIDCGVVINPDIVEQQMEGSIIFALTAATKSSITVKDGQVEQSNFHNYPILKIDETPEIEVIILSNEEAPGGIGEPGVPPLAPALANAILAATGKPVRELPVKLSAIKV
ncbi:molybdopterin cofactor-binding domain-containing protein [Thiolapillus sp.]